MNASQYQTLAARTLIDRPDFVILDKDIMLIWNAVGLAGETGEIVEHVKKGVFHRHGVDHAILVKEIGDALWYLAALCTVMGVDMSTVMEQNIEKLNRRYPNGWSSADSIKRVDVSTPDK